MKSTLHLRAASVNDGYMGGYFEFLLQPSAGKSDALMGGAPFGDGLKLWLERSPSLNWTK